MTADAHDLINAMFSVVYVILFSFIVQEGENNMAYASLGRNVVIAVKFVCVSAG